MDIASRKPVGSKLLSILLTGRDDDYMLDFKYRITTTINYIARNLHQLGRLDDVEILVTDWGSRVPMAQTLPLSPEAGQICRFLYVPPTVVRTAQDGEETFHTSLATNAGLRRGRGEYLMVSAADTLIPEHALETILALLGGRAPAGVVIDRTYFMCSRYRVPLQFVERRPTLIEWDRYLLLNAGRLDRGRGVVFSISSGAGALIMHRSLWHEFRGLDERLSGWGNNDVDLGLRVTQCYPWVELSSLGVSLFHMEHVLGGPTPSTKKNAPLFTPSVHVNDEHWGLGGYDLQVGPSENIQASGESGVSRAPALSPEPGGRGAWDQSWEEVLAELRSREVREHVKRVVERALMDGWNFNRRDMDSLLLLSWYSKYHHPGRFLTCGIGQCYSAVVVAACCPNVELYAIDRWEGVLYRQSPIHVATFLWGVDHHGYVRFINGDISTGLQRLRESFIGPFSLDLALIRNELLGADAAKQISQLLPYLTAGGALVVISQSADRFASLWNELKQQCPQFTYIRCDNGSTGLILAASLQDDGREGPADVDCRLQTEWLWRLLFVKCQSIRLYRALKQPRMYREYTARAYRWVRRKTQNSFEC